MEAGSFRVSDSEREEAVVVLKEHLLEGRLTLEEFSERAGEALKARVTSDLVSLRQDLPQQVAETPPSRRRRSRLTLSIFSHVVRRGRFRLPRVTVAASVLGDVDLDLRSASIENERTRVIVLALLGNVDIYVPEGIDVDMTGVSVFGHRRDFGEDAPAGEGPVVRVQVIGLFGAVDIWRVPASLSGDYKKIQKKVRTGRAR